MYLCWHSCWVFLISTFPRVFWHIIWQILFTQPGQGSYTSKLLANIVKIEHNSSWRPCPVQSILYLSCDVRALQTSHLLQIQLTIIIILKKEKNMFQLRREDTSNFSPCSDPTHVNSCPKKKTVLDRCAGIYAFFTKGSPTVLVQPCQSVTPSTYIQVPWFFFVPYHHIIIIIIF